MSDVSGDLLLGMDVCTVIKACNFAAERHSLQRRKDILQTPYINHPIGKLITLLITANCALQEY